MFDRFCHVPQGNVNQSLANESLLCSNITNQARLYTPNVSKFTYAVELYFIGIVCLIGLPANIVSIVVMRRDKERRGALFLLQVLAVADGFYLFVALLRYPLKHLMVQETLAFQTMQLYIFPLLKTAQTIAIFMMVFVTVDRYIYVCVPLRAHTLLNRRKRWIVTIGIFIFGLIFNMPRFVDMCILTYWQCGQLVMAVAVYTHHFNHSLYYDIYQCALYIIVLYAVPLASLIILNIKLISAIRRSRRRHRLHLQLNHHLHHHHHHHHGHHHHHHHHHHHANDHHDNNATMVLVIIILVFIVCETPELIFRVITSLQRRSSTKSSMNMNVHYDFATVLELLMVINSSTNFFIYCIFGRRFRQVMKDTFQYHPSQSTVVTHEMVPLQQQLYQG